MILQQLNPMFAALALLAIQPSQAGPVSARPPVDGCHFEEAYREEGWAIPGVPAPSIEMRSTASPHVGPFGVRVETIKPAIKELAFTYPACLPEMPQRLQMITAPFTVLDVTRLAIGKRVYQYHVSLGVVAEEQGQKSYVGSAMDFSFVDVDGSGKFRVLRSGPLSLLPIPAWIRPRESPAQIGLQDLLRDPGQHEGVLVEVTVELRKSAMGYCVVPTNSEMTKGEAEAIFTSGVPDLDRRRIQRALASGMAIQLTIQGRLIHYPHSTPSQAKSEPVWAFAIERITEREAR